MKTILNTEKTKYLEEPLFFGNQLGVQRYDKFRYPNIFDLFKKQVEQFWRPEEYALQKDRSDFITLSDHEKRIFTLNLKYQIILDTIQSRGIQHLLEYCSNPEFEAFCKAWEFFETIHSYSYTYLIRNVYAEPSKLYDEMMDDVEIKGRAASVIKYYDELINSLPDESDYDKKKKLYLTLVSINILESIRFYVSFVCTFSFAQNKKMEGSAKIIKSIMDDEAIHAGCISMVLRYLREDESEGFSEVVKDCEQTVIKMYKDSAEEEMVWAEYLFKDGSLLGLNAEILQQYMKYLTNQKMKMIKLEPIFDKVPNPIGWISNWVGGKIQVSPQEVDISEYVVGSYKNDMDDVKFDFDL